MYSRSSVDVFACEIIYEVEISRLCKYMYAIPLGTMADCIVAIQKWKSNNNLVLKMYRFYLDINCLILETCFLNQSFYWN